MISHGKDVKVFCANANREFAETVCKVLNLRLGDSTVKTFADLHDIDTLIINALRHKPHMSHMSLSESLDAINRIKPRVAYLTHMSNDIGLHDDIERQLPDNVHLAYDGLTVKCPY